MASLVLAAAVALTAASQSFDRKLSGDGKILHALNRLTFGPRPGDLEAVREMGLDNWIDAQLHPGKLRENPDLSSRLEALGQSPSQDKQQPARELIEAKLLRAIYSERQLDEQLTDFWFNHFNVNIAKGAARFSTPSYERDAIRPHIWGKFRDLLGATAAHPAMLFYLDNWQNTVPNRTKQARGINENYARELLELHTLGVDNGYTQKDIVEVARCFTGWTILQPRQGGEFLFNPRMHDDGEKIVLGVKIPANGGRRDGERVLDILAKRPETARFISTKLAQRFVTDAPPPALIERMAKKFRETDGDLRAVIAAMIQAPEFFSEGAQNAKVKTPLEFVVSAVRAAGADVRSVFPLTQKLNDLGQPLYRKVEPTGYSTLAPEWVNSAGLLARMNFAVDLTKNRVPGTRVDASMANIGARLGGPEFQRR